MVNTVTFPREAGESRRPCPCSTPRESVGTWLIFRVPPSTSFTPSNRGLWVKVDFSVNLTGYPQLKRSKSYVHHLGAVHITETNPAGMFVLELLANGMAGGNNKA